MIKSSAFFGIILILAGITLFVIGLLANYQATEGSEAKFATAYIWAIGLVAAASGIKQLAYR